jgi:predicted negative regulator of RcsB-dependent stress response
MFINTKILSLITLLLFSGAAYGAYNYWQSNVPPKQTFLLQGFEQTLEAVDEKIEERSKKEFEDFKKLVEKENIPAGIGLFRKPLHYR